MEKNIVYDMGAQFSKCIFSSLESNLIIESICAVENGEFTSYGDGTIQIFNSQGLLIESAQLIPGILYFIHYEKDQRAYLEKVI